MVENTLLLAVGLDFMQVQSHAGVAAALPAVPGYQVLLNCQVQYKLCGSYHSCHTLAAAGLASGHSWAKQGCLPLPSPPPTRDPESTHPAVIDLDCRLSLWSVLCTGSCNPQLHCFHNHHSGLPLQLLCYAQPSPKAHCCCHPPRAAALLHTPLRGPLPATFCTRFLLLLL